MLTPAFLTTCTPVPACWLNYWDILCTEKTELHVKKLLCPFPVLQRKYQRDITINSVIILALKSKKANSTDLDSYISVSRTNVVLKTSGETLRRLFKWKVTYWIFIFNVLQSVYCGILTACTWKCVYQICIFTLIFKLFSYCRRESGALPSAFIQ